MSAIRPLVALALVSFLVAMALATVFGPALVRRLRGDRRAGLPALAALGLGAAVAVAAGASAIDRAIDLLHTA